MDIRNTQQGKIVWWLVGLAAIALIIYVAVQKSPEIINEGQVNGVGQEVVVIEGEVVCLPHRDTSGPTTLECAYGLRSDEGTHYGLDTRGLSVTTPPEYEVGDRIAAEGTLVASEDMPPQFWDTYDIVGLIALESFWKFTEK